jgi:peptidoglycan-N-acetylglucosamine deacetylase
MTFDDGPHPEITPWVLTLLKDYQAHATFFCIGNNVRQYPDVFEQIQAEGHGIGNHTYHHMNGWKAATETYLNDVAMASKLIDSHLFRPPYGRLRNKQAKRLNEVMNGKKAKVIMWDVLSADFDRNFSPEECLVNVTDHVQPGSILVFHDSEKAFRNLKEVLPKTLEFLKNQDYMVKKIEL